MSRLGLRSARPGVVVGLAECPPALDSGQQELSDGDYEFGLPAASLQPSLEGALLALVEAYQRLGRAADALVALRSLQVLAPDDPVVRLSPGRAPRARATRRARCARGGRSTR